MYQCRSRHILNKSTCTQTHAQSDAMADAFTEYSKLCFFATLCLMFILKLLMEFSLDIGPAPDNCKEECLRQHIHWQSERMFLFLVTATCLVLWFISVLAAPCVYKHLKLRMEKSAVKPHSA